MPNKYEREKHKLKVDKEYKPPVLTEAEKSDASNWFYNYDIFKETHPVKTVGQELKELEDKIKLEEFKNKLKLNEKNISGKEKMRRLLEYVSKKLKILEKKKQK